MGGLVLRGLPQIQMEADVPQQRRLKRTGGTPGINRQIQFGIITDKGPMWETAMQVRLFQWVICDFGDKNPRTSQQTDMIDELGGPIIERNQWLFIHLVAGVVCDNVDAGERTLTKAHEISPSPR